MNTVVDVVISRLAAVIIEEASHNQAFTDKLQTAIMGTDCKSATGTDSAQKTAKHKRRRDPASFNPIDMILEDEDKCEQALHELSEKQLKDIIAEYRMDPSQRAMHWRNRERLIQLILDTACRRAAKGDAFRDHKDNDKSTGQSTPEIQV